MMLGIVDVSIRGILPFPTNSEDTTPLAGWYLLATSTVRIFWTLAFASCCFDVFVLLFPLPPVRVGEHLAQEDCMHIKSRLYQKGELFFVCHRGGRKDGSDHLSGEHRRVIWLIGL